MILERLDEPPEDLAKRTGWEIKPEGACREEVCVPLPSPFDVRDLATRLGMALVQDEEHGLWALGPESGGRDWRNASARNRRPVHGETAESARGFPDVFVISSQRTITGVPSISVCILSRTGRKLLTSSTT